MIHICRHFTYLATWSDSVVALCCKRRLQNRSFTQWLLPPLSTWVDNDITHVINTPRSSSIFACCKVIKNLMVGRLQHCRLSWVFCVAIHVVNGVCWSRIRDVVIDVILWCIVWVNQSITLCYLEVRCTSQWLYGKRICDAHQWNHQNCYSSHRKFHTCKKKLSSTQSTPWPVQRGTTNLCCFLCSITSLPFFFHTVDAHAAASPPEYVS